MYDSYIVACMLETGKRLVHRFLIRYIFLINPDRIILLL